MQQVQQPVLEQPVAQQVAQADPAPAVTPITSAAPAAQKPADDGRRIKLGDISSTLGFTLTADFLASLGFEAVAQERSARLYRASDFEAICTALIHHIQSVRHSQAAA